MVSAENDSQSNSKPFPLSRSSHATTTISSKTIGRSMRTIRSNFFRDDDHTRSFTTAPSSAAAAVAQTSSFIFENLTDSVVDFNLCELASRNNKSVKSSLIEEDLHELSRSFSDFSACSSDISGELQRLARVPPSESVHNNGDADVDRVQQQEPEPCLGFLQRESFSTEIIESISPEDLLPTVKICIDGLQSLFVAVKRSAAAKLRLLAKNRADNRVLIGESGVLGKL